MRRGEATAFKELVAVLYDDLHRLAAGALRAERPDHTLQPTALVNELYLRMVGDDPALWNDRGRFLGAAANAMRRVLVDHARARLRVKRGGGRQRVELHSGLGAVVPAVAPEDVIALHEALDTLGARDERAVEVVHLLYFAGLTAQEAADVLGVSSRTVERDWRRARAYLVDVLAEEGALEPSHAKALLRRPTRPGSVAAPLPARIGRYPVARRLGTGGLGDVFLATDTKLDRKVAIKVLKESVLSGVGRQQIEREARLLASMNHPNIATLYSLEEGDGTSFLTMEWIDGQTLAQELRQSALDPGEVLATARQLALAVAAAHDHDVLHLDLKPANVMRLADGRIKVLDFGLGRRATVPQEAGQGLGLGTPGYMSPEQYAGHALDSASDIWSLGAIFYELITSVPAVPPSASPTGDLVDWSRLGEPYSDSFQQHVQRLLADAPHERPAASLVLAAIEDERARLGADPDPAAKVQPRPKDQPPPLPRLEPLYGRQGLVVEVEGRLEGGTIATLTGAAGVGKTAVALGVAHSVAANQGPENVHFVDLAAAGDERSVWAAVASAFDVRAASGQHLIDAVRQACGDRAPTVVLDNCERALKPCANLVSRLADEVPGLRVLVTSRQPLHVRGEQVIRIEPLGVPSPESTADQVAQSDAAQLFLARAGVTTPLSKAEAGSLSRICRSVDGLPLAIELVAARATTQSLEQLATQVGEDRFSGGQTGRHQHHQSLDAAIRWSYDLLSADERAYFRRTAVFASGWVAEVGHAVAGTEFEAWRQAELLSSLVDRSLVEIAVDGGLGWRGGPVPEPVPRYRLLGPVRVFAADELRRSGDELPARQRLCHALFQWVGDVVPHLRSPQQARWLDLLEIERDNVRTALECAVGDSALAPEALVAARRLGLFWALRGDWSEAMSWYEALLGVVPDEPTLAPHLQRARADATVWFGNLAFNRGEFDRARTAYQEAQALAERLDNQEILGRSLTNLGAVALSQGEFDEARRVLWLALRAHRARRDRAEVATVLLNLGVLAERQGQLANASRFYRASLTLRRRLLDPQSVALSLNNLGVVQEKLGDLDDAKASHEEALEIRNQTGDRRAVGETLFNLAAVEARLGQRTRALECYAESYTLRTACGDTLGAADALDGIAVLECDALPAQAIVLTAAARGLRQTLPPAASGPTLARQVKAMRRAVKKRLGVDAFERADSRGASLSGPQVAQTVADHISQHTAK